MTGSARTQGSFQLGVQQIISGGQSGADQGGLAAAVVLGLRTGGWTPKGWRTETGPAPWLAQLGLQEHHSARYQPRTKANVGDADGTLVFGNPNSPGCLLTRKYALAKKRPYFELCWGKQPQFPDFPGPIGLDWVENFQFWLVKHDIQVLNVAGNRESTNPGIRDAVRHFLVGVLE